MQDLRRRRQDLLRGKLSNRDRYVQKAEEIDRLIRQAVIHYRFEAIHPFDGSFDLLPGIRAIASWNLPPLDRRGGRPNEAQAVQ